jgi:uncharacterized iron-regulated membrane protein
VNGSLALVFISLILAGVALWWPATRRALKAGLTLNPKLKGRPWSLNLHKAVGIYAAILILFSASSGLPIAFESTRSVLDFITGSQRDVPPAAPAHPAAGFVGFEAIGRRIDSLMPQAKETYIALPKSGLVTSYAIAADAPHPNARSYVWLDGSSGTVTRFAPYAGTSAGYRLYYWLLSLHTGVTGGPAVSLLLLCGTLSVPVLLWTGVAGYLRRKSRRSAPVQKEAVAAVPAGERAG